jgi:hypothetical protein
MNKFYNVSPIINRLLIQQSGLIAALGGQQTVVDQEIGSNQSAVTLFSDKETAIDWIESMILFYPEPGVDLWEVEVEDLKSLKQDQRSRETFYSLTDIQPENINFVKEFLEKDVLGESPLTEDEELLYRQSNILDPVHGELDQDVFNGTKPKIEFFGYHLDHIKEVFRQHGFNKNAFDFYLTGSLCTYQYSETSDVDISIVCNLDYFSEEDRADLISIVINNLDGTFFPRTRHRYQHFVQPSGIDIYDLFSLGTRAAWDFQKQDWVIEPKKNKTHDILKEKPDWISTGIQISDKINAMIDSGNDADAKMMYQSIHERRRQDEKQYGDYSEGNIIYKLLDNNGTFDRLRNIGQRIA